MSAPVNLLFPSNFTLQWHITEKCNWKCRHCYRDKDDVNELPLEMLSKIVIDYIQMLDSLKIDRHSARINIAGGEPFLRKDFFDFLKILRKFKGLNIGILTNGSLIDKTAVKLLKISGVKRIQISIEGMEENNDFIRGYGTFKKIMDAVKLLVKEKFYVGLQLTLTKKNMDDLPKLLLLSKKLKINRFAARRFVPIGCGEKLSSLILTPNEQKDIYLWREKTRKELKLEGDNLHLWDGCEDGIFYQETISEKYSFIRTGNACAIIHGRLLVLFPNGDVLLCRRLPIKIGNAVKNKLIDIYFSSNILWQIRNVSNAHPLCHKCKVFSYCLGGAKCIIASYFNKLSAPDPHCWRLFNDLPEIHRFDNEKEKDNTGKIILNPFSYGQNLSAF